MQAAVFRSREKRNTTEEITDGKDIVFEGAEAEHIRFAYGDEVILDDISVAFEPGRITGITGNIIMSSITS